MARIRSVSPELRTSETAAEWPREVRYAWVLLWGYLDDYGRGLDNARIIRADLFPLDDDVTPSLMGEWLDMWEGSESICRYEHDGKRYLHALSWDGHQKPQHPGKVRIPPCPQHEPDEHRAWSEGRPGRKAASSRDSHETVVRPSPTRGRGSKELSKEGEGEVTPPEPAPAPPEPGLSAVPPPPTYPAHCPEHAHTAVPGKCGNCKDARMAFEGRPRLSVVASVPARTPHCGECDETRHRETPLGAIRCPECHPLAEVEAL